MDIVCNYEMCDSYYRCNVQKLTTNSSGITKLSKKPPLKVEMLTIENIPLESFPRGIGAVFSGLEVIQIVNCGITRLTCSDFEDLSNLTFLQLSQNRISELPSDVFACAPGLKYLLLDNNELTRIPRIDHLENLEVLVLDGNRISTLTESDFASVTNLIKLFLIDNLINFIHPKTFESLVKLKKMDLRQNTCIDSVWEDLADHRDRQLLNEEINEKCQHFDPNPAVTRDNASIETSQNNAIVDTLKSIFIARLRRFTTIEDLQILFQRFGQISTIAMPKRKASRIAFIEFASADSVLPALRMDKTSVRGCEIVVARNKGR